MLKNWGSWFGSNNGDVQVKEENVDKQTRDVVETEQTTETEKNTQPSDFLPKAKGVGGYVYNFASSASKKLSESVVETAQTLKKSVEEGKLNKIIDKTILGDFQKEQQRFVQENKAKKFDAAVPPWVGYNEEDTIQEQILALSADKRNFLRNPPAGVQFHFDFEEMYPVAMVMLEEDELLRKMRFHLVPKQVNEEIFWKNYFYRVSLIKQSAQLTSLAAQQAAKTVDPHHKESVKGRTSPAVDSPKPNEEEEQISTSPPPAEFISDAFDSSKINQDDLRKGMEQLVLDQREGPNSQQEEIADWERELQEELQEYDVLADNENRDENWEREIEEMLQKDGWTSDAHYNTNSVMAKLQHTT